MFTGLVENFQKMITPLDLPVEQKSCCAVAQYQMTWDAAVHCILALWGVYLLVVECPKLFYYTTLKVVTLSYMWLLPSHPDPSGDQLAFVTDWLKKEWPTVPLSHIVVFWDYASMDQAPRKPEEEERFRRALKSPMNILYCSVCTNVLMLTSVAAWSYRDYNCSGWCNTEKAISSVIKPAKGVRDLGHAIDAFEASRIAGQVIPTLSMQAALKASGKAMAKLMLNRENMI